MPVTVSLQFRIDALESVAAKGAAQAPATLRHLIDQRKRRENGTSSRQQDLAYSDRLTVTTTPQDLDLAGGVSSELDGSTITMVEVTGVYIRHRGDAGTLNIGGATNALGIFSDASDVVELGPGGLFVWESPLDGLTVGAGASDVLRLVASAGSIDADVVIVGRSA